MTLVDAFTSFKGNIPSRLLLVGDGPYRRELEERKDRRIIITGYRYGEALSALYASSDIFVFPSLTDTYGNVMQEAMASGLPVVAFDTEGPRSVVKHFETGLLVKEISARALGRAMEKVAVNGELAGCLAEGALEFALGRDWDQVNSVCLDLYDRISLKGQTH
jgi:glycosyltransferase involved in cell wall biosynthesis